MEQWFTIPLEIAFPTIWSDSYITDSITNKVFPVSFINTPKTMFSVAGNGRDTAWIMVCGVPNKETVPAFYLVRSDSLTGSELYLIEIHAIGRWK